MQIRARVPLWAIESFGDRIKKSITYWISFQLKPRQDMTIHTARLGCNLFLGLLFSRLGKVTEIDWFIHSTAVYCISISQRLISSSPHPFPQHPSHVFPSLKVLCQKAGACRWRYSYDILGHPPFTASASSLLKLSPPRPASKGSSQNHEMTKAV